MNTDDRELLELAAKAAGIFRDALDCEWYDPNGHVRPDWNPLTDDGDALRLAVKLGMVVDVRYKAPETMKFNRVYYWPNGKEHESWKGFDFDLDICPCAATRRAIVRAAAEIGRGVK